MRDLALVVADKNMRFALEGALSRPEALGIRPISFEIDVHSGRDGGARSTGPELLTTQMPTASKGILVLDFEGSGAKHATALDLEAELDGRLAGLWPGGSKSIVIEPELDIWMWGSNNSLANVLDWPRPETIREWLGEEGFEFHANGKPVRPKECLEALVPIHQIPRSSATYKRITSTISLANCHDPAFVRLRDQLQLWFPP